MKRATSNPGRQPWWSQELANLKVELSRARRNGLHRTDSPAYNRIRNVGQIWKAKMESWRSFASDLDLNTWGKAFRWAKNGTNSQKVPVTMNSTDGTPINSIEETFHSQRTIRSRSSSDRAG